MSNVERDDVEYHWKMENQEDLPVDIDTLAESAMKNKGIVILNNIKRNNVIRGRCEITSSDKKIYLSDYFHIITIQDGKFHDEYLPVTFADLNSGKC